jgi:hypothetical protein
MTSRSNTRAGCEEMMRTSVTVPAGDTTTCATTRPLAMFCVIAWRGYCGSTR